MKGTEIGVGFCEVLDSLGEVGCGKKARIRLAESGVGFPEACFFEMVQVASAGEVPRNLAFVKKIEVPFEGISGFGGTTGEGANDSVLAGEPDGEGTFIWPSGDQYTGQWKAGKKHGKGAFTWKAGDRWEGEYENDVQKN